MEGDLKQQKIEGILREYVDFKVFLLVLSIIGVALGIIWDELKTSNSKIDIVANDVSYIRGKIEDKKVLTSSDNLLERMHEDGK